MGQRPLRGASVAVVALLRRGSTCRARGTRTLRAVIKPHFPKAEQGGGYDTERDVRNEWADPDAKHFIGETQGLVRSQRPRGRLMAGSVEIGAHRVDPRAGLTHCRGATRLRFTSWLDVRRVGGVRVIFRSAPPLPFTVMRL